MLEPPTNIRARQGERVLELEWADGRAERLAYRYIRGECPCAFCRDEWTGERILDPEAVAADLILEGMEPIGNYAVRFSWSDGHASGLYTWEALRLLADAGRS